MVIFYRTLHFYKSDIMAFFGCPLLPGLTMSPAFCISLHSLFFSPLSCQSSLNSLLRTTYNLCLLQTVVIVSVSALNISIPHGILSSSSHCCTMLFLLNTFLVLQLSCEMLPQKPFLTTLSGIGLPILCGRIMLTASLFVLHACLLCCLPYPARSPTL